VHLLIVTANAVPSSPILGTLMMEALISSETSVLTRGTPHDIPQDVVLYYKVVRLLLAFWNLSTVQNFIYWKTTFRKLEIFPSSDDGREKITAKFVRGWKPLRED
jgi:hypothetical protein